MENCYQFTLADGQVWTLIATRDTKKMVKKAASIMGLRPGTTPGSRKLIFVTSDLETMDASMMPPIGEHPELRHFPDHEWKVLKSGHVSIWSHPDMADFVCEVSSFDLPVLDLSRLILSLYPVYREVTMVGGMLFHTALLEYRGRGILVSAKSGTGKSTCSRHATAPWQALCDDQALIVKTESGYRVHPFPTWSDYTEGRPAKKWDVNQHVPLSAIFFLEQSTVDEVEPIGSGKGAQLVYETSKNMFYRYSIYIDQEEKSEIFQAMFDTACKMSREIPSFKLRASLNGRYYEEIERALEQL